MRPTDVHTEERLAFGRGGAVSVRPAQAKTPEAAATPRPAGPRSTDWAAVGLLGLTLMLFVRPQDTVPALGILHPAELFAILALSAMLIQRSSRGLSVIPLTPEVLGIIGFGAIILGGIPFSFWPGGTYTVLTEVYVKVVLVFMAMIATLTTVAKIRSFLWTIVLGSTYVAAMTIANFARGASVVEGDRLTGAGGGVFGNPNDLALNMLAFLPFTLVLALHSARALSRWFAGLAALLMLTCTVLTKSRGGFLGLIAVVLVLFLLGGRIKRGFRVVIVAACLLTLPLLPASFWSRMGSLTGATEDETGSWDARQRLLQDGWQAFCERPLMGVGAGQFQAYNMPWRREPWRETHNVWLQVAAEMGVVGVVAFAFLVLRGFSAAFVASRLKRTWRAPTGTAHSAETASSVDPERKRQSAELRTLQLYGTASLAALAGWAVTAMFASVAYNWTFYYLLGFAAATRDAAKGVRTATRRPAPKAPRAGVAAGQA